MLAADALKSELGPVIRAAATAYWTAGAADAALWLDKRATALRSCQDVRAFRDAMCGGYTARPSSCRVRVCPDCERARSARLVGRLDGLTLDMLRPVFWTFTVPNVAHGQLARGIDWLLDSFRALRRRAVIRGGKCRDCGARHRPVAGGVYSLEVTPGRDGATWHPHLHVLMDSPWLLQSEIRAAWQAVTCDAARKLDRPSGSRARLPRCPHPADDRGIAVLGCRGASIVWVSAVKGDPGSIERRAAIRETLKYATGGLVKDGKLVAGVGAGDIGELLLALRNRRLVAGWAGWRHVHDSDADDELPDSAWVLVDTGTDDKLGRPITERMPAACPHCRQLALWEAPISVPRRSCVPRSGVLMWSAAAIGPPS